MHMKPRGEEYIKVKGGGRIFRRLMGYWLKHWKFAVVVIGCLIAVSVLDVLPALYVRRIVDTAIRANDAQLVLRLAILIVGVTAASGVFSFVQRYLVEIVAQRVIYHIRKDMYESLQSKSFAFFDRTETGQLMSRTTMDVDLIRRFLSFGFRMIAQGAISFAVVLFVCVFVLKAPVLTLLAFSTGPLIVWAMMRYSNRLRKPLYRSRDAFGEMSSVLQESLSGSDVVTAFGQEDQQMLRFGNENERFFDLSILLARIRAMYNPMTSLLSSMSTVAIIIYGGYQVVNGNMEIGVLIAFTMYVSRLTRPLHMLGNMTRIYRDAVAGGQRVFEIMDSKSEVTEKPDARELEEVEGRVTFENVSFGYSKGQLSLKDVSFDVAPGETVILLGATGSGKSTIINLIPRFYDPDSGSVKMDGHDLRDLTIKSVRENIGIVPQETFLFSTSIKENIAYGRPDASMEEIVRCAEIAEADSFIRSLPNGYDTKVGERGATLSGGEKQRVAIARALLIDPRILILDDSTSSVDTETEYEIQKALENLMRDRTTFVITQRLSMMRKGSQIMVLEDGRIAERGTHEELIRKEGVYHRIYEAQSSGDLVEEAVDAEGTG